MKNTLHKIAGVITFGVLIFGILVIGIVAHEYKHYYDLKDDVIITEICVLNMPFGIENVDLDWAGGYVNYISNKEADSSEFSATVILIIVVVLLTYIVCFFMFADDKRNTKKEKKKENKKYPYRRSSGKDKKKNE